MHRHMSFLDKKLENFIKRGFVGEEEGSFTVSVTHIRRRWLKGHHSRGHKDPEIRAWSALTDA